VSDLDATLLARHTRLLLRFYPKAYRAHRGEEILGTLLDTTRPGRNWPPAREVASVIGGGLRARRAANLNQGLRASLRHVGILTAAMMMAGTPATLLSIIFNPSRYQILLSAEPGLALASLLVVTALAAAWCGWRWLAVQAAAAATVFEVVAYGGSSGWALFTAEALVLVALLALTRRSERPPASLLWLPCLPVAVNFVEGVAAAWGPARIDALPIPMTPGMVFLLSQYTTYLSLVPVLVAVCWLVTDVRPLAALAIEALLTRAFYVAFATNPNERSQMMIVVVLVLLALTVALAWLLRQRARSAPPTIG
jgi:hypothetical protein